MKFLILSLISLNLNASDLNYKVSYDKFEEKLLIHTSAYVFIELTDNKHKIMLNCNQEIGQTVCPLSSSLFESTNKYILHDMSKRKEFSKDDIKL